MRWIVDGMNVIGSRPDGWWRDRRRAMAGLVADLDRWAAAERADVTVVFEQPLTPPLASAVITIANAPAAAPDSADDEIVRIVTRMVAADDQEIRVVTSDRRLTDRVTAAGASVVPATALRVELDGR
jgi:predicted RNA-binding protein with PIN domain